MPVFENLFLLCVFLFFPLTCYLIYITYISNMDIKEKNIFLDICLITSLFLIARYIDNKTIYVILFYNIPLLLSYIKKKTVTSIFLNCSILSITNSLVSSFSSLFSSTEPSKSNFLNNEWNSNSSKIFAN